MSYKLDKIFICNKNSGYFNYRSLFHFFDPRTRGGYDDVHTNNRFFLLHRKCEKINGTTDKNENWFLLVQLHSRSR